jgi:hypothetical protein
MKINYDLTKEDFIEFNMHHFSKSKSIKRTLFIERYVISIMFLIIPFIFKGKSTMSLPVYYGSSLLLFVGWIVFFPKYFKYSVKKKLERMLNSEENSKMFGPQSLSITDAGISESEDLEKSKFSMGDIEKVDVTEKAIYIYISSANAYVIPVRAFKTHSEKHELIDLLKRHLKVCVE